MGYSKECRNMELKMEYEQDTRRNVQILKTPWNVNRYSKECTNMAHTMEYERDTRRNVQISKTPWNVNGILKAMQKYRKHHGM